MSVLVAGRGPVGLATALTLAQRGIQVRVRPADERPRRPPHQVPVSNGPAAPETVDGLAWLARVAAEEATGVDLVEARLSPAPEAWPWWTKPCGGVLPGDPPRAPVPVVETSRHTAWLEARLLDEGATLEEQPVHRLWGHAGHGRVVVNAGGPAARRLARDAGVEEVPVAAVELSLDDQPPATLLTEGPPLLVEPIESGARLVGAVEWGRPARHRDPAHALVDRAAAAVPALAGAEVVARDLGRGCQRRGGSRVEAQRLPYGGTVVHSYGYGPLAPAVAWGTRERVADLVERALAR